jgi:hypothetical protein
MFDDVCQWDENCKNPATRIAAKKEGGIIDICNECWHRNFKS